jgi:acyl-CoA synthetase (AMP-forming)/AMP-acid ligase II
MYLVASLLRQTPFHLPYFHSPDVVALSLDETMIQQYTKISEGEVTDVLFFGEQFKWAVAAEASRGEDQEGNKEGCGGPLVSPEVLEGVKKNLKRLTYGGLKFPTTFIKKAIGMFPNTDFYNMWGMTELCGIGTILWPGEHRQLYRLDSIGRPRDSEQMAVMMEDGSRADVEEVGEICVHRSVTAEGYLNDPEKTSELFFGDWMRTGDLGKITPDGYVYLVDRLKDVVILPDGMNIYSTEVEEVLSVLPGVKEVAVVGVPSEFGEAVKACIVRENSVAGESMTMESVTKFCTENLAMFKVPEIIEFFGGLPKKNMKVDKPALRYRPSDLAV